MQPPPHSIWANHHVRLRAVEANDWASFWHDSQDSDAARFSHIVPFPMSQVRAQRLAEQAATSWPENDIFRFAIENVQNEMVGTLNTHSCEPRHGTFSYGLTIFRPHQRRGYASAAIELVLRYFFHELRYQKANVQIYSFNEPSMRLHESLGFQREGVIRRNIYTNGAFWDQVHYGITSEEWAARRTDRSV